MRSANLWRVALPNQIENWQRGGFGLYIHWPFCLAKCPYCDFNSHVQAKVDQSQWKEAFLSEIQRTGAETQGRVLNSIFFGGGTPSLMDPDLVHDILDEVRKTWTIANDIEINLEANPTSVEAGRFRAYAAAGVNRLSMGIQALNDPDLKALGRMHSAAEAKAAFDVARAIFPRISFDLIYARQNQTAEAWGAELREAIAMAVDHFSLYQLTIEPGTAFGARHAVGKLRGLPDEDLAADMWDMTQRVTEEAGLPAYETSNHAWPGRESRHNQVYWRQGDYIGIGPGAHGRVTLNGQHFATEAPRMPNEWLKAVREGKSESVRDLLSREDVQVERLMMGLRLSEGVSLTGLEMHEGFDTALKDLIETGLMWQDADRIGTTPAGRPVLNGILRQLLAD